MEEVTTIEQVEEDASSSPVTEELVNEETTLYNEFTSESYQIGEYGVDSMLSEIVVNSQQSAECLTSILALVSVIFIFLIGKFLYNVFHSIFS